MSTDRHVELLAIAYYIFAHYIVEDSKTSSTLISLPGKPRKQNYHIIFTNIISCLNYSLYLSRSISFTFLFLYHYTLLYYNTSYFSIVNKCFASDHTIPMCYTNLNELLKLDTNILLFAQRLSTKR